MSWHEQSDSYAAAVMAGFRFAHEVGSGRVGPVHFLIGVAEGDTDAAHALKVEEGLSLRQVVTADSTLRPEISYLQTQVQGTARRFAEARQQEPTAAHLLVALLDQGTAEVLEALRRVGIDPGAARRAALRTLDAPANLPPVELEPLTPAGTDDRPALPIEELDEWAWAVLLWRQDHLPLDRVRRTADWHALSSIERRAAWRVAGRGRLDDDQRYSLSVHHHGEVERRAHAAKPAVVETRQQLIERYSREGFVHGKRFDRWWTRTLPNFMVGWPTWFGNRWVGLRDRRFSLATRSAYRGQPNPTR